MSELKERLRADLTAAMKARDELVKSTLRMTLTAVGTAEVAGAEARELSDDEIEAAVHVRREGPVALQEVRAAVGEELVVGRVVGAERERLKGDEPAQIVVLEHRATEGDVCAVGSVIATATIFAFLVLIGQLWYLQVLEGGRFLDASDKNRIRVRPIAAPRGILYDRHGMPLVDNRPAFTLSLIPRELPRDVETRDAVLGRVASLLRIPYQELIDAVTRVQPDSLLPVRVLDQDRVRAALPVVAVARRGAQRRDDVAGRRAAGVRRRSRSSSR